MARIAIGDADGLIALILPEDGNHKIAIGTSTKLYESGISIIFPNTAILEAVTTLKRALNKTDKAELLNNQYQQGLFRVIYIIEEIQKRASKLFGETISKKHTIFDCVVLALAQSLEAEVIFSFDKFYKSKGFRLASELKTSLQ